MRKHVSPKKLSARKRGIFVPKSATVGTSVGDHVGWKTFTEKSFEFWSQYVCGVCKNLVFRRQANSWVCDKGHSTTKEFCADWVDDIMNTRIRMPDGCLMYLSE